MFYLLLLLVWTAKVQSFLDFIPDNETQTCSGDTHSSPWVDKIIGVNIGGWMVLEPWITPSLFYQFLGRHSYDTAMDSYSFCKVLGPEEGNKQLRRHWQTWVSENHIQRLAGLGINSLRLPVGDWLYAPYPPYIGCYDGGLEAVDQLLEWAKKYDLKVLIDVHAVRRSANGLDNGGITTDIKWTSTLADVAADAVTFEHWPRRSAHWMGNFDRHTGLYQGGVNWTQVEKSIHLIESITHRYANNSAVLGIEPVNEPWQFTPIHALKKFYWESYLRVKTIAPHWRFIMHDSFRFDTKIWGGFMAGCPDRAIDTHIYQAWQEPSVRENFYANACAQKDVISQMEKAFGPVIVGEWSLATDNCAMWLNGFNDNLPGYPKLPCKYILCAQPYMGINVQPGAPPSLVKSLQGPFGTGVSGPLYGLCPVDRDWGPTSPADTLKYGMVRSSIDLQPEVSDPNHDETNQVMTQLAHKKLQAFALVAHGFYFWNFRTELEDQWSYLRATERGWIPKSAHQFRNVVAHACDQEDVHCKSKPSASDEQIRDAVKFAILDLTEYKLDKINTLSGLALRNEADLIFTRYWIMHRKDNVAPNESPVQSACDFNGTAELSWTPYKCHARRIEEKATRDGMAYVVGYDPNAIERFNTLHGERLYNQADSLFQQFWSAHRFDGATCDFGGAAILVKVKGDPISVQYGANPFLNATITFSQQEDTVMVVRYFLFETLRSGLIPAIVILLLGIVLHKVRSSKSTRHQKKYIPMISLSIIKNKSEERIPLSSSVASFHTNTT
mmetsp:Transcript_11980/g.17963  ORF Transcript_11980/g.17963 Transcript_11980/m.17963 type:complete len:782 (-) Transcript_11980:799-3144(-)